MRDCHRRPPRSSHPSPSAQPPTSFSLHFTSPSRTLSHTLLLHLSHSSADNPFSPTHPTSLTSTCRISIPTHTLTHSKPHNCHPSVEICGACLSYVSLAFFVQPCSFYGKGLSETFANELIGSSQRCCDEWPRSFPTRLAHMMDSWISCLFIILLCVFSASNICCHDFSSRTLIQHDFPVRLGFEIVRF